MVTASPAAVELVISRTSTLPPPQVFRLISYDKLGYPQPLPGGLGVLPLYLDQDGFCSINGPLDFTFFPRIAVTPVTHYNHSAIHPLITNILASPAKICTSRSTIASTSTVLSTSGVRVQCSGGVIENRKPEGGNIRVIWSDDDLVWKEIK